ncbi:MAG: RNA polymerase sigma factor [Planctomycetota bacterium]|nr:RNA polymerase sigma factor [Planctomycetota bacterium]
MALTTQAQQILNDAEAVPGQGVPEAFWQVVERYRMELVNQAVSILGSLPDAEDVVQETFCEAFQQPEKLRELRSLGAYLRSINKRNALDRFRAAKRDDANKEERRQSGRVRSATTGGFTAIELREALTKAIENLSPKHRAVVVLRFWEGLSYEVIAARLRMPTTNVWRTVSEASELLFGKLAPELKAQAPGESAAPPDETQSCPS